MRIAVAGSHGLIGSALLPTLDALGHDVHVLVRRATMSAGPVSAGQIPWDPETIGVPPGALTEFDAVIGLNGIGIANARWSAAVKQQLRDSRITPTAVLAEAVANDGVPVFLSASATGFYGDTGAEPATESHSAGTGFLPQLVCDWESATATAAGARVVQLRTAPVLSPHGGTLAKLVPLYRMGLGGRVGDGRQFFSWISLADEIAAIAFLLGDPSISGPVNLSAPEPVRYAEFSHALGGSLRRPAFARVPGGLAGLLGGELVRELVLTSSRVVPGVLTDRGFTFAHPTVEQALEYCRG